MKVLSALLLILALAAPLGAATPLPFASTDVLAGPGVVLLGVQAGGCSRDDVVRGFQIQVQDKTYRLVIVSRGSHEWFFLMDMSEGDRTPAWGGEIQDKKLVVKTEVTWADLQKYQTICDFLFLKGA